MEGKVFGHLTVKRFTGKKTSKREKLWLCQCDCGNTIEVTTYHLNSGHVQSCGHMKNESGQQLAKAGVEALNGIKAKNDGIPVPMLKAKNYKRGLGIQGVSRERNGNYIRYRATITIKGKRISLGSYSNLEDAVKARKDAEEKYLK